MGGCETHPMSPFSVTDDVIMGTQLRTESIRDLSTAKHCHVSVKLSRLLLKNIITKAKKSNNNNNNNNYTRRVISALIGVPRAHLLMR